MKKILIIFTVFALIFLNSCDPRSPLTEKEMNELYNDFKKEVQNDSVWIDNYIIIVGENAFMSKYGTQYVGVDSTFDENELSNIFNQYKKYFKNGLSYLDTDSFEFNGGWKVYSSIRFCNVKIKSDWLLNGENVPVSSFTFNIYDDGRLALEINPKSDNEAEKIIIYFNITDHWEQNLISMHQIVWK